MTLGATLLHSETLRRPPPSAAGALAQDVLRLSAIIAEDAAAEGPMARALEQAIAALGDAVRAQVEPRLAVVQRKLRQRLNGPRRELADLAAAFEAAGQEPAAIVALLRRLIGQLAAAAGSLTLNRLRQEVQVLADILEGDLGIGPAFLAELGLALLDDLRDRWQVVDARSDPALRRRLRIAGSVVARMRQRLDRYEPPRLEVEVLARAIHRWLQDAGVNGVLAQARCALDAMEQAAAAAQAAGQAVSPGPAEPVGAGIVPLPNAAEYAWYASWLLSDEDLPLLGIGDIERPRQFVLRFKIPAGDTERLLRGRFGDPVRATIDAYDGVDDPSRELMLVLLAALNVEMQRGPIYDGEVIRDVTLSEDLEKLELEFRASQRLFHYNRAFLERALAPDLGSPLGGFVRGLLDFFGWPRNQLFVTGDRRFVICDDKPLIMGENLKWTDAPIFEAGTNGQLWFKFEHISPAVCEGFAQHLAWSGEAAKAVWHLITLPPGHAGGGGGVSAVEFADSLQQLLFGKPLSGHLLEQDNVWREVVRWLDSGLGLKALGTVGGSFSGLHTAGPGGPAFVFWFMVFLGDLVRTVGPSLQVNTVRDVILSFITLLNFRGPRDAPSTLPSQPARNHVKQDPIVSLSDSLFLLLLVSLYKRDDYSIEVFSEKFVDVLPHWLGGSVGLGLASGLSGGLFAQITAWAEDWDRLGKTIGYSMLRMGLLFWPMLYLTRENDTDGGRYRPGGGRLAGYPPRDSSPYRLPYAARDARYVSQANLGFWSHNFISGPHQVYAYDFGHDFREPITAVRAGTIVDFEEGQPDSGDDPNWIVIRHAAPIDPMHDVFAGGPVQTYSRYLHLATNGVTDGFGGTTPAVGDAVIRGQEIGLAGDTGNSAHNHVHLLIHPDDGSGNPNLDVSIPFVFGDVPKDGVPKSLQWYRSGNA